MTKKEITAYQLRPLWTALMDGIFPTMLNNNTRYLVMTGTRPMLHTHLTVGVASDLCFHLWHCFALAMGRGNSSEALYDHVLPVYQAVDNLLEKSSKRTNRVSKILEKASDHLVSELNILQDSPYDRPQNKSQ